MRYMSLDQLVVLERRSRKEAGLSPHDPFSLQGRVKAYKTAYVSPLSLDRHDSAVDAMKARMPSDLRDCCKNHHAIRFSKSRIMLI